METKNLHRLRKSINKDSYPRMVNKMALLKNSEIPKRGKSPP